MGRLTDESASKTLCTTSCHILSLAPYYSGEGANSYTTHRQFYAAELGAEFWILIMDIP